MIRMRALPLALILAGAGTAFGQTPPASPDDTPSIRVGAVIYADWTRQQSPQTVDSDGNTINPNAFNVTRSYINIIGNVSHLVAFRITPDIARETSTFSNLTGSLEFRIKYAYAQFNLDDWLPKGSWAKFGIQQTPWLDYAENIYRYRFQGTTFVEREGYFASADAGASFELQAPSGYGDVHVGVFNGENYNKAEANDQKALMIRASARPFAQGGAAVKGVIVNVFYDKDAYVLNAPRDRFIASLDYQHKYVVFGLEYLSTKDQTSRIKRELDGKGYSIWVTPRATNGWEALLRYDHLEPDTAAANQVRNRTIAGVAYWFPHQGNVASALLFDYDGQTFDNFTPAQPKQSRLGVHGLISF